MPASIAAMKGRFAIVHSGLCVDVFERGFELWEWTLDAESDGSVHFARDLGGELVGFRAAQHATLDQGTSEAGHRVATQRGLVLPAVAEDCDRFVLWIV